MRRIVGSMLVLVTLCICISGCGTSSESNKIVSDNTTRYVVDMKGTTIELPEKIDNIAITWTGLIDIVLMLNGSDDIVAYPNKSNSFDILQKNYPDLKNVMYLPDEGISAESLADVGVKIVFAKSSDDEILVDNLRKCGIVVVDCDFKTFEELQQVVTLISEVFGTSEAIEKAKDYNTYINDKVSSVINNVNAISEDKRVSVLVLKDTKNLSAYGSSRYTGKWAEICGGRYAMVNEDTYANVNLTREQLLEYDPDYIFFSMPEQAETFIADEQWADLKAVKNGHVYNVPNVYNTWSSSGAESALIFEWAFSKMYPDSIEYIQESVIEEFYNEFYGSTLTKEQINSITVDK